MLKMQSQITMSDVLPLSTWNVTLQPNPTVTPTPTLTPAQNIRLEMTQWCLDVSPNDGILLSMPKPTCSKKDKNSVILHLHLYDCRNLAKKFSVLKLKQIHLLFWCSLYSASVLQIPNHVSHPAVSEIAVRSPLQLPHPHHIRSSSGSQPGWTPSKAGLHSHHHTVRGCSWLCIPCAVHWRWVFFNKNFSLSYFRE